MLAIHYERACFDDYIRLEKAKAKYNYYNYIYMHMYVQSLVLTVGLIGSVQYSVIPYLAAYTLH